MNTLFRVPLRAGWACCIGLLLALPLPARAQLEEVVVTARKREEKLQQTPISITAFTSAQLELPAFEDLTDVSRFAPNLTFMTGTGSTGGSANAQVFIRGVGQTDFLFSSDPGVGIYVDDVFYPRSTGAVLDLVDLERVEVLRGPQGTLFGKNTVGGAINIVSQRPGKDFGALLEVTGGSRSRFDGRGSIDLPLIPGTLHARFTISARDQDGYVRRVLQSGARQGDVGREAARLQLNWLPGDWDVMLTADYSRRDEESIATELIAVNPMAPGALLWNMLVAPFLGGGLAADSSNLSAPWTNESTGLNYSDFESRGVSLVAARPFGGNYRFKSVTAYREQDSQFAADADHSPLLFTETSNDNEHDQFSQELQLNGTSMDGRLNWVAGLFYMRENGTDVFDNDLAPGLWAALEMLPFPMIPLLTDGAGNPICPCAGGAGNPVNVMLDFDATLFSDIRIDSYAVYAQGTYDLTDRLGLTVGGRYTQEEKDFTSSLVRNASGVISVPPTTVSRSWDAFTPKLGLEFQWTPKLMTYVTAARGFKSGGFNGRAQSPLEIDAFDPEYLWSYEAGLKSEWLDRRLVVNLAAFHNRYKDIQLTSLRPAAGILAVVTENAGKAEVQGFELEFVAQPADGFLLRGGVGYIDAEYTSLNPLATVTLDTAFVKTPEWSANAAAQYSFAAGDAGTLTIGADLSYRSKYYNETTNLEILAQKDVTVAGAFLRFQAASGRWEVTAFGTNLGDERYMVHGFNALTSFGSASATFAPPREWGLTLRLRL
ncbi:MAG: TonB-dependent receptor [Gammaproteobacteria bacterium]|nr:TonB-dependent receptor [Gammaproteobacteria bacterium]